MRQNAKLFLEIQCFIYSKWVWHMDLETFGLNVSHEQHTFKQVFYYENSLPFPAHSCLEFIMSGGENEGDY